MAHTLAQTTLNSESLAGTPVGCVRGNQIAEINNRDQAVDSSWSSVGRGDVVVVLSALMAKTVRKAQTLIRVELNKLIVA